MWGLLIPEIIFEIMSSVTSGIWHCCFFPNWKKNSNLLSSLDLYREWVYTKLLWSGKILLAAVSHRFQNDSRGSKSFMHVSSEGEGEGTWKGEEINNLKLWIEVNLQTKKDKWKIHIKRVLISKVKIKSIWNVTT